MNFKEKYFQKVKEFEKLRKEIWEMERECQHEEYDVCLVESLGFDLSPRKKCVICKNELDSFPSEEEIKACYKEELEFIDEREYSDEEVDTFYKENPKGYNLPSSNLFK